MPIPRPRTYAEHLNIWSLRLRAMAENAEDFADQEVRRTRLQAILDQANDAIHEQKAATAVKQEASRKLEALITEGMKLATFLNACVRQQYGSSSEKLAEFLLQPFRGRRSKEEEEPPPPPEAAKQ